MFVSGIHIYERQSRCLLLLTYELCFYVTETLKLYINQNLISYLLMEKCSAEICAEDVCTTKAISSIARTHNTCVFPLCLLGQSLESLPLPALRQRVAV